MASTGPGGGVRAGPGNGSAASVERFFELALLGLVTSGYLAVLASGYLDRPTAALTALGLLLRGLMVTGLVRFRVSRRLVSALTLAYAAFYAADYLLLSRDFLTATVHMVFFLAVMKVLTAESTRDHVFVAVIAFLELLAASVLSSGLSFFIFLGLFLFFGVATFASAEIRRSMRKPSNVARGALRTLPWRLAGLTCALALGILALTAGLFFLLPRTAQAAFQHLVPQRYHIPGFSNEMVLGQIGEIQKLSTPVMHVRFIGSDPPRNLKWRGNALMQFNGQKWDNPPDPGEAIRIQQGQYTVPVQQLQYTAVPPRHARRGVGYEVHLTSIASDSLFFAGTLVALRIDAPFIMRTPTGGYRLGMGTSDGLRYGAFSYMDDPGSTAVALTEEQRIGHLMLPHVDPRVIALARQVTAAEHSDEGRARAIETYLRTKFRYTTELLSRPVPDPLAYFLLERREGHCEYFASAMAVMLRIVNVPARVATGFQSGVYNPVSGWWVIRASDAHSWVEAWLPGRGWLTFDPTPPDPNPPRHSLWSRIGLYLDAAQTFWREWVLNYNLDRQLDLASQMESSSRSLGARWFDRLSFLASKWAKAAVRGAPYYGLAIVLAALLAVAWFRHGPRAVASWRTQRRVRQLQHGPARASDATLLYGRMLAILRRRGFEKPAWLTPSEFARLLPVSDTALLVEDFTIAYNDLRFGGNPEAAPRMVALLERLLRLPPH